MPPHPVASLPPVERAVRAGASSTSRGGGCRRLERRPPRRRPPHTPERFRALRPPPVCEIARSTHSPAKGGRYQAGGKAVRALTSGELPHPGARSVQGRARWPHVAPQAARRPIYPCFPRTRPRTAYRRPQGGRRAGVGRGLGAGASIGHVRGIERCEPLPQRALVPPWARSRLCPYKDAPGRSAAQGRFQAPSRWPAASGPDPSRRGRTPRGSTPHGARRAGITTNARRGVARINQGAPPPGPPR